jgi:hypothetical protein
MASDHGVFIQEERHCGRDAIFHFYGQNHASALHSQATCRSPSRPLAVNPSHLDTEAASALGPDLPGRALRSTHRPDGRVWDGTQAAASADGIEIHVCHVGAA